MTTSHEVTEVLSILQTRHRRATTIAEKQFAAGKLDGALMMIALMSGDKTRLETMRAAELAYQGKAQ